MNFYIFFKESEKIRRITISLLILLVCHSSLESCYSSTEKEVKPFHQIDHIMGIAHRGGAKLRPENTLLAFELASEMDMDAIELDVNITKDNQVVVIHDKTIDRTTNATGKVKDFTIDELKELDAAYWFTPDEGKTFPFRGTGVTIPTLEEVFDKFFHMRIFIDVKENSTKVVDLILESIAEYNLTDQVNIFSFHRKVIKYVRRKKPELSNAYTIAEALQFLQLIQQDRMCEFDLNGDVFQVPLAINGITPFTSEFIEAAHSINLMVHIWTVNDQTIMEDLIKSGVDGIITDRPDLFIISNN